MDDAEREPVFLDAELRPNPPLSGRAMLFVLVAVGAVNFVFGLSFVLRGAWPIMPFMGADLALLAWGFHATRRKARWRERVTLTTSELTISRRPPKGPPSQVHLNPYWVRVQLEEDVYPARKLTLWSHGRAVPLGSFLAPSERERLAEALKRALRDAKTYRPA